MSVPELAGEDSFIRWVTKGENDQRWSHWLDQDPERTKIISEAKLIVQALSVLPSIIPSVIAAQPLSGKDIHCSVGV